MDAAIARGRIAAAAVPAALWLGLYAAWLAVRPGGRHALTIFSDTAYLVPIAVAFGLSVLASLRATRGLRLFWAVVAASNLLWLVGESLWSIKELLVGGGVPDVWWTDAAYLGAAGLLPVAIVLGFRPTITMVSRAALLEAALVIGTLTMLWWYFMLRPHPFGTGLGALVPLAYPCLDLLVLGMLLATRLLPSRQGTIALAVFAGGVVSTALADASYAQSAVDHNYYSGAWLDMGWQIQAVLFASRRTSRGAASTANPIGCEVGSPPAWARSPSAAARWRERSSSSPRPGPPRAPSPARPESASCSSLASGRP